MQINTVLPSLKLTILVIWNTAKVAAVQFVLTIVAFVLYITFTWLFRFQTKVEYSVHSRSKQNKLLPVAETINEMIFSFCLFCNSAILILAAN